MDIFLDILKYTIPTIISLIAVYLIIAKFLKNEEGRRNFELRKEVVNTVTPIKLRAYERLVLFLERTAPESLILRVQQPSMNSIELQTALLVAVREEYEHNLSQQIYVSNDAAIVVKNARESLVQLINMASTKVEPTENSTKLSILIIETYYSVQNPPAKVAIDFLKAEIKAYFG
jgi:hypothetical protein